MNSLGAVLQNGPWKCVGDWPRYEFDLVRFLRKEIVHELINSFKHKNDAGSACQALQSPAEKSARTSLQVSTVIPTLVLKMPDALRRPGFLTLTQYDNLQLSRVAGALRWSRERSALQSKTPTLSLRHTCLIIVVFLQCIHNFPSSPSTLCFCINKELDSTRHWQLLLQCQSHNLASCRQTNDKLLRTDVNRGKMNSLKCTF